jgi:hypothetical protein
MRLAIPCTSLLGDTAIAGAVCINLDTGEPIPKGKTLYPSPPYRHEVVPRKEGGYWFVYQGELC